MWGNSDNDFEPENKGDFDLPDMNDGLSDSFGSGDNLVYAETSFDDGLDFDTSGLDGNTDDAPFSFDDLSDFDQIPETAEPEPYAAYSPSFDNDLFAANLEEAERHNHRLLLPVIICVVCAIISVAVLGITLFTLWGSKPEEDEVAEEIVVTTEETEFQRPVAKENEIIVSDQVFLPSFLQTEEKTAGAKNVQPGVSDGTDYGNASQRTDNTIFLNSGSVFAGSGYSGSASSMELALQGQYVRYKVKWGDTLWDIANSYYRNPWLYWRIAMVNNITNPNKIVAGSYIIIPE
ncbi:MAG: LysM peptidoglycan-binding domain-containing protein [Treponemataceae bacterium]|nr:LysM peptidoglycan-binding domain-containing protein [Treponemataceae bacterium]